MNTLNKTSKGSARYIFVFCLVMESFLLLFIYVIIRDFNRENLVSDNPIPTLATVTEFKESNDHKGHYTIEYRYRVGNQTYTRFRNTKEFYRGETIPIFYSRDYPQFSVPQRVKLPHTYGEYLEKIIFFSIFIIPLFFIIKYSYKQLRNYKD